MASQGKRWVEISVESDRGEVDDIVGFMNRYCAGGAVIEERAPALGQPQGARVVVKGFLPEWDEETLRKLEIALLLLGKTSPLSEPRITTLEPEDWAESWKAYFPPLHVGESIVIVPTWRTYQPQDGEQVILLDPGMAFGTGLHATTRLCLVALERVALAGQRVLDVGTGSGILAIAAALQGATFVQAIDNDPVAVAVAQDNVTLNRVDAVVQVGHGTLGTASPRVHEHVGRNYDVVLANILAEVIVEMAPAIPAALSDSGVLIASGIIEEKADLVAHALAQAGLRVDERPQEDDWVALIARKS